MLQSMRRLAHSWVVKGLMMLLIVSFGIWGIGDMFRGNPLHNAVAKVGAATITVQDLNRAFEQTLARARQMLGPDITAQQARQMGLEKTALDGLIENALVEQDLKRLGIEADDRAVFRQLMQSPQLKDKDGKFDKSILQNALASAHVSERDFLNQQRKELATRQLIGAFSTAPDAPQTVIDALYKARGQKRILDIVTLDNASLKPAAVPDDQTLRAYYQKNPQGFTTPEMRGITIAVLSTDAVEKDITISDDQLKKDYDAKGDQLSEPEKRDILQVVVQEDDKAKALSDAARQSGNLVAAAKPTGHEVMPLNGTQEADLLPELAKPVFALPKGGVTQPIKTALGWHVIQVRKITPAGVPPFDEIKESLRATVRRDQAIDTAARLVNQLDDELAAGHALEDIADGMKLRLIKIPAVDATGKTPDGKAPAELPYKDAVLKTAFAQNAADTSPVMDDKAGSYFTVRTDAITPSALKPFEQVRNEVIAAWQKQDRLQRAEAKAADLAKALRDGKPAASLAGESGVTTRLSKPVSLLGDTDATLPKTALAPIMAMKKGDVITVPQDGKQLILRLADIVAADNKPPDAAAGKISSELRDASSKEMGDEYLKYLRVLFPVKIHQDVLDSLAQQGG